MDLWYSVPSHPSLHLAEYQDFFVLGALFKSMETNQNIHAEEFLSSVLMPNLYRYTQFGLKYLLESAGYMIERIDWPEGYFGTVGYQLRTMSSYLPIRPRDLGGGLRGYALSPLMLLLKSLSGLGAILFHRLEVGIKFKAMGYPKNYVAVVRKDMTSINES